MPNYPRSGGLRAQETMTGLRLTYLVLTIVGIAIPAFDHAMRLVSHGFTREGLLPFWMLEESGWRLTFDHAVAVLAFAIWSGAETWIRRNWAALFGLPLTLLFGLGAGLPWYLFIRSRPID